MALQNNSNKQQKLTFSLRTALLNWHSTVFSVFTFWLFSVIIWIAPLFWYFVAKKVMNIQLGDEKSHLSNGVVFGNAFIEWNYKILFEPMECCTVAEGRDYDYVADKMHNKRIWSTI